MKFKDLKPGDLFRTMYCGNPGEHVYLVLQPGVDIFHLDRVVRMHEPDRYRVIPVSGDGAGGYDGVFRDDDPVERAEIAARKRQGAREAR